MRLHEKRIIAALTAIVGAPLTLGGCGSTPAPVIGLAQSQPSPELGQAGFTDRRPTTYLLRPADTLSINVFREADFTLEEVRIGVEGNISVPMLGSIPAAGMTAKQFEQDLTRRLAAVGLKTPMVSVNIVRYASHQVTVEGDVMTPGVFSFEPGARLSAALAMAKGVGATAKRDQVVVFRETPQGLTIAKFDYGQISQGTMMDPVLQPNDRVVVGTNGLAAFWRDFVRTIPAFGVFAAIAAR